MRIDAKVMCERELREYQFARKILLHIVQENSGFY